MPGPLPDPTAQRRNKPTIPTTSLPARGRKGAAPKPPKSYELGDAGTDWWRWAWKTPQAAGWSTGDVYVIARRAQLEDDLAAIGTVEGLDALELVDAAAESVGVLKDLVGRLAALASGRLAVCREMRDLDDRLGLTPKGMAALRWKIVDEEASPATVTPLRSVPTPPPAEDPRRLLNG